MNPRTILRNFGHATPADLENIRQTLNLSMAPDVLTFCMKYYKDRAQRDPFADELQMLDRLCASLEEDIDAISPTDFYTNDDFAAETYADLIKKRRLVNPYAAYPCTLKEAAMTATAALMRAGRTCDLSRAASRIPESLHDHPLSPNENCITSPNAAFRLRVLPSATPVPREGDLLILLTPGYNQTQLQFQKESEKFLENEAVSRHIQGVYSVHQAGILRTLLALTNGVRLVLTPFSALNTPMPLTVLTDAYGGCRILRIRPEGQNALMQVLCSTALCASVFAKVTSDGLYTFVRGEEEPFSIHPQFLRLLFHRKGVSVRLADESLAEPDRIAHRAVTDLNCRYLKDLPARSSGDIKNIHDTLSTASSASPTRAFFKTAFYAALLPIATLCTAGADFTKQDFSLGLEMPANATDPEIAGECMSVILGLYRAQTELGLPAQAIAVRTDRAVRHPTVTAFALGTGRAPCAGFRTSENRVYCITPAFRENGLPDFPSLRSILEEVTALAKNGDILSARVLGGESITDGIRMMSGETTCILTDPIIATEGAVTFGILIETKRTLKHREVGITAPAARQEEEDLILPEQRSLIWSEVPEIVILAQKTDSDAQMLSQILSCRGANVHLYSGSPETSDPLSRALLGAQTLILCRHAKLPGQERVRFALETMKTAGGILISLDTGTPTDSDTFHAPNGLSTAVLERICPSKKKI